MEKSTKSLKYSNGEKQNKKKLKNYKNNKKI